jgi:hypothetical protein
MTRAGFLSTGFMRAAPKKGAFENLNDFGVLIINELQLQ